MGRKLGKLKVELIENKKSRNLSFKRRKECLAKKAKELSTLCDVSTCVILYAPEHDAPTAPVSVWPPNDPALVRRLIRAKNPNSNSKKDDDETQLGVRLNEIAQQIRSEIDRLKSDQQDQFASAAGKAQFSVDELEQRELTMDDGQQQDQFGDFLDNSSTAMMMQMPGSEEQAQGRQFGPFFDFGIDDDGRAQLFDQHPEQDQFGHILYPEQDQFGHILYPEQQQQIDLPSTRMMMMDDSADQSWWAGFDDHGASCSTQAAGGDDDVAAVDDFYNQHDDFVAQLYTPQMMTWTGDDLKFTQFQENGAADFWKCIDFDDVWASLNSS